MIGYIYEIRNLKNNKIYLGSTIGLRERMRAHFNLLKNNKHHSDHLQNSYNKYGIDSFKFNKLETIKIENRDELFLIEAEYIRKWKLTDRNYGYNISTPTARGGAVNERLFKPVVVINTNGELIESYESIAEASRELDIRTSSICDSMKLHSGRFKSTKFVYKEDYDESKDYSFKPYDRSEARYGKKVNKYSLEGKFIQTYDKISEAEVDNNMKPMLISSVLNGNQKSSGGFLWRHYEGGTSDLEIKYTDIAKVRNPNVYQFDKDGNFIAEYNAKTLPKEFKMKGVRKCIYGERQSYKGYVWMNNKNML